MDELSARGTRSLRNLFEDLVWRHFFEDIGLDEPQVAHYVSRILSDFSAMNNFYSLSGGARRPQLADILIASNPMLEGHSFDHERSMRKYVGDFTLFMSGLYPENVASVHQNRADIDSFVDFIRAGKESYAIVSSFDQWEYRDEAPLFRRLSENFELCVAGLNFVKHDLEEFQRDSHQRLQAEFEGSPGTEMSLHTELTVDDESGS